MKNVMTLAVIILIASAMFMVGCMETQEESHTGVIARTIPGDGEKDVPLNTTIEIFFRSSMGGDFLKHPEKYIYYSGGPILVWDMKWLDSDMHLVITLASDLLPGTWYTITISSNITDISGAHPLSSDYSWRFKTVEKENYYGHIIDIQPHAGEENVPLNSRVAIFFDIAVNKTSIRERFTISPPANGIVGFPDDRTMIYSALKGYTFEANTTYTCILHSGIKDVHGNVILDRDITWSFKTLKLPEISAMEGYDMAKKKATAIHPGAMLSAVESAVDDNGDGKIAYWQYIFVYNTSSGMGRIVVKVGASGVVDYMDYPDAGDYVPMAVEKWVLDSTDAAEIAMTNTTVKEWLQDNDLRSVRYILADTASLAYVPPGVQGTVWEVILSAGTYTSVERVYIDASSGEVLHV